MSQLNPEQRNYDYLVEAARVGIHKPILAALYAVHRTPQLIDGNTGLGITPANQVIPLKLDTFAEQTQYAANTIRALTDNLIEQGWGGTDLWDTEQGRYSDKFLQYIAKGYIPKSTEKDIGRLEPSDYEALKKAYINDIQTDYDGADLPKNLSRLDQALVQFVERVGQYYKGLPHQRESMLETVRIWRKLDSHDAVIESLVQGTDLNADTIDETELDLLLTHFIKRVSPNYGGFPHQREALIRFVQLWRQMESRETTIQALDKADVSAEDLEVLDPAIMRFVKNASQYYVGKGSQRNSLTEALRLWRQLNSRQSVLSSLGVEPAQLQAASGSVDAMRELAKKIDQELVSFIKRVPNAYQDEEHQRDALIRAVQLWRGLPSREQAIASLTEDLKQIVVEPKKTVEPVQPITVVVPKRPSRWTPATVRSNLSLSIIPNGSFTWLEATHGGKRLPTSQATVDAIIRIARLAQQARDRLGRPMIVTSWYRPPAINRAVGGASRSRHIVGDAIDFVVSGLSGNQIYWTLDPWWPGGLGRYRSFPNLGHIDARPYRARWRN
ncbi:D-Ala-D-Ala carboxypeptidase family metallohydrolase [[Limnothrix rosea] IAM M-220]|uniref:D-Ala-D-Ala carboxypeptidase family metallohydrolase n=1 Tax=[Limnothrix rosea] IAM M-220 TaxID=454133 RepID=UPI00095C7226|nr:D-Ala-D-Ala carboxypeptidase family metallohydrolase [[Limnothrix rosea] IAM M-220]OKH16916.1 peptidase M15A [[Limnothrix rosea] IAM M-220]